MGGGIFVREVAAKKRFSAGSERYLRRRRRRSTMQETFSSRKCTECKKPFRKIDFLHRPFPLLLCRIASTPVHKNLIPPAEEEAEVLFSRPLEATHTHTQKPKEQHFNETVKSPPFPFSQAGTQLKSRKRRRKNPFAYLFNAAPLPPPVSGTPKREDDRSTRKVSRVCFHGLCWTTSL